MMKELEEIKKAVGARLSRKRFEHTAGVAETAVRLAARWGADPNGAYIAALVHDYAKEIPIDETLKMLNEAGIAPDRGMLECPAVLHGPLAAYLAEREFGISDRDILNAVRYHTTGRRGMSQLEKVIYLADFIEPNRSFDGVDEVRVLAEENLDRAVLLESDMVIRFTLDRGLPLYVGTVETRNDMLKRIGEVEK